MKIKTILKLLTIVIFGSVLSCNKSYINEKKDSFNNKAETEVILNAEIISINPFKLKSPDLVETKATIKGTNIETYGYVLKKSTSARNVQSSGGNIERGWFLYGRCAVYGTLYTGDNGIQLFVPCGINCVGYNDVCPPGEDEWLAKFKENKIELRFN